LSFAHLKRNSEIQTFFILGFDPVTGYFYVQIPAGAA